MVTIVRVPTRLIVGVDSHKNNHQAAVLDEKGALLGNESFAATTSGYHQLEAWLATMGEIDRVGMECTGSFAAGLTRFLRERDVEVLEASAPVQPQMMPTFTVGFVAAPAWVDCSGMNAMDRRMTTAPAEPSRDHRTAGP